MNRSANPEAVEELPWYKQFWPWFLIALPASVVIAGTAMIVYSFTNADSLVDDDYYRSGLAINQNLNAQDYASAHGMQAQFHFFPQHQRVKLELSGNLAQFPQTLSLAFSHPTDAAEDFTLALESVGGNSYAAESPRPIMGRWYFKLSNPTVTGEDKQQAWLLQSQQIISLGPEQKYFTINAGSRGLP